MTKPKENYIMASLSHRNLPRAQRVLGLLKSKLSAEDYDEVVAYFVACALAGDRAGATDQDDMYGPRDTQGEPLGAMDAALRRRRASYMAGANRLADAHAKSIGIKRPRQLGN